MGCTSGVAKCALNIMNVLLLGFGALLIVAATCTLHTAPPSYYYYLYTVGGIVIIAALLGCCGICQEDTCMTTTYALILLGILVLQVCGKIFVSDFNTIKNFAADTVKKTWAEEIQHSGAMNKTQSAYHCCGQNGPHDYDALSRQIPESCYSHPANGTKAIYNNGCILEAQRVFTETFKFTSSSEWGNLIFSAVMCLFAVFLAYRFHSKSNRGRYYR